MDFESERFTIPRSSSRKQFLKRFTVPRLSFRKQFVNSLDILINPTNKIVKAINRMLKKIEKIKMSINFSIYIKLEFIINEFYKKLAELKEIVENKKNRKCLEIYKNYIKSHKTSEQTNENKKIKQKFAQEGNVLIKNGMKLKSIIKKIDKYKDPKILNQLKGIQKKLEKVCTEIKKKIIENEVFVPNVIISYFQLAIEEYKNAESKINALVKICRRNERIQSYRSGFFGRIINRIICKCKINTCTNCVRKNKNKFSKYAEIIKNFYANVEKNINISRTKATGSFDKNFTYQNLKEIFRNLKFKLREIYSNPKSLTKKGIKNVVSDALNSNSMPESKNEKKMFSCLIYIKTINYLFTILNGKYNLKDINSLLTPNAYQTFIRIKNVYGVVSIVTTILSVIATIASFVLPLFGFIGTALISF